MQMPGIEARSSGKAELERALIDTHERTWSVLANLAPEQWHVPYRPGILTPVVLIQIYRQKEARLVAQ